MVDRPAIDLRVPKVVINAANVIHDYAQNCLGLGEKTSNWNGARECIKYFRACNAEVTTREASHRSTGGTGKINSTARACQRHS